MKTIITAILFASFQLLNSQSVEGIWKTVDDKTREVKSKVKIYIEDGKMYGKVYSLYIKKGQDPDPLCKECKDELKNAKVLGMQIINGLEKNGKYWEKDNGILDPENGTYYDVKIWLEDENTLNVRGYVGFLFRTQTWYRIE